MSGNQQIINVMENSLGPVVELLDDPDITDIEVLGSSGEVMKDGVGGRDETGIVLPEAQRSQFIFACASYADLPTDPDETPSLSTTLPEKLKECRIEASFPPITPGPAFTMRKPATTIFPITDYASQEQISFLREAIRERKNILIAGSTSSGKTSLLKSILELYGEICPKERMIIIEDTKELVPVLENTEFLKTAVTKTDHAGNVIDMSFLVKKSLRLNPDRIVLGEVRGKEADSVLEAWDTGHGGGICTFHAPGAERGFYRFVGSRMADLNMQRESDRRNAADAIDIVLYLNKGHDGVRRIEEIAEVYFDEQEKDVAFNVKKYV